MEFLTLNEAKAHLNISESDNRDDAYISGLIDTAVSYTEKAIYTSLNEVAAQNSGAIPPDIKHALKLLVGHFYANREPYSPQNMRYLEISYNALISYYRDITKL